MRIAIVTSNGRQVGGTETYLARAVPELGRGGHEVGFWYETDLPADREPIVRPGQVPTWCAAGGRSALAALQDWRPHVIYAHGLRDRRQERDMLGIAPVVFRAHNYYGTCISGGKTFTRPAATPCTRCFGPACFLHYYPRRCGGLSPLTMWTEFRHQRERLDFVRRCAAVVANSRHIGDEYLTHGVARGRVHVLVPPPEAPSEPTTSGLAGVRARSDEWRLLFMGRMDRLKGGDMFVDALPEVRARLARPVRVTFASDGPERSRWERRAREAQARTPGLVIDFVGWLDERKRDALWGECDLFVLPSVWPEPYGLVGLEAGRHAVPVAAFAVGGIPEWLSDGVNGHLAPGDPPRASGLADAIVRCLADPTAHARLREGARATVARLAAATHFASLVEILARAAGEGRR